MKGAVAAGHPLTAQAGARVLAEGGNAVDACVAAAFAAAVTESPLTGPGRRRLHARPPRARPLDAARRLLRRRARARPERRRGAARWRSIDVGFGGDDDDAAVPDRPRVVRRARRGRRASRRRTARYGRLPWRELLAAGDRARPRAASS